VKVVGESNPAICGRSTSRRGWKSVKRLHQVRRPVGLAAILLDRITRDPERGQSVRDEGEDMCVLISDIGSVSYLDQLGQSESGDCIMDSHVYKTIQITGSSPSSSDDAVRIAVERAGKTVHNLKWFKVTEIRGYIKDGKIADWQVSLDLGFALE
jgi:dodecin